MKWHRKTENNIVQVIYINILMLHINIPGRPGDPCAWVFVS